LLFAGKLFEFLPPPLGVLEALRLLDLLLEPFLAVDEVFQVAVGVLESLGHPIRVFGLLFLQGVEQFLQVVSRGLLFIGRATRLILASELTRHTELLLELFALPTRGGLAQRVGLAVQVFGGVPQLSRLGVQLVRLPVQVLPFRGRWWGAVGLSPLGRRLRVLAVGKVKLFADGAILLDGHAVHLFNQLAAAFGQPVIVHSRLVELGFLVRGQFLRGSGLRYLCGELPTLLDLPLQLVEDRTCLAADLTSPAPGFESLEERQKRLLDLLLPLRGPAEGDRRRFLRIRWA